ncbi:MAG: metallophosphoesterase, partial [Anaeroplasmataceae bacterium]
MKSLKDILLVIPRYIRKVIDEMFVIERVCEAEPVCVGFDVLKQVFFVHEYFYDENTNSNIDEVIEFKIFRKFYNYLKGDIYINSCYFGYKFSKEEMDKYNLIPSKINVNSYIDYNIDNYSFDVILEKQLNNKEKIITSNKLKDWYLKLSIPKDYQELLKMFAEFKEIFYFDEIEDLFFSLIIKKKKEEVKLFVIDLFCVDCYQSEELFSNILINYGVDVTKKMIDSLSFKQVNDFSGFQNKKVLNNIVKLYSRQDYYVKHNTIYDYDLQLFVCCKNFIDSNRTFLEYKQYFFTFEELTEYLNNDLTNTNLSYYSMNKENLLKYKTDETTIFPLIHGYSKYCIEKGYNDSFYVNQIWLDKYDNVILKDKHNFDHFCDFCYFIKNDLSDSNLLKCTGLENLNFIDNLNLSNVKIVSNINNPLNIISNNKLTINDTTHLKVFEELLSNEVDCSFEVELNSSDVYEEDLIAYISDIHLNNKINLEGCNSIEDVENLFSKLVNDMLDSLVDSFFNKSNTNYKDTDEYFHTRIKVLYNTPILIAGDTTSNIEYFKIFIDKLASKSSKAIFITLGNHEYWDYTKVNKYSNLIDKYKCISDYEHVHLVHNNLYYITGDEVHELTTANLLTISDDNLRGITRDSNLIIFGGTGFAGANSSFNANNGMYLKALNRTDELEETKLFNKLYDKVVKVLYDKNVIILTHMPLSDWKID